MASETAGARIHGGRKLKSRWEEKGTDAPDQQNPALLYRLSQHIEYAERELREFVQEEYAVLRQTYLHLPRSSWSQDSPAR